MTDFELLQRYGRHGDQDAFATIVARHVDLVHAAARRQVRSTELAAEVTQTVFLELSRDALRIAEGTHLAGWLYVAARRRAIDAIRRESRRRQNEHAAAEFAAVNFNDPDWSQVEAVLDEALSSLGERDREAVLLRYFEDRSLREIGLHLGTNEDAAQKRLSRAMTRLRDALARHGVTTTAAALAANLAAGATSAPSGLAATVTGFVAAHGGPVASGLAGGAAGTAQAWLGRPALWAGAGFAAAIVVLGQLVVLPRLLAQQAEYLARRDALALLQAERARARTAETTRGFAPASQATSTIEARLRVLLARADVVRTALDQIEGARVPELAYIREQDWIAVAQQSWDADTAAGRRQGVAHARLYGKANFAPILSAALRRYLATSGGIVPGDAAQLALYFASPVDAALLARFSVSTERGAVRLREAMPEAFDAQLDRVLEVGQDGWSVSPVGRLPEALAAIFPPQHLAAARAAALAYGRGHGGASPPGLDELLPHFADPTVAAQVRADRDEWEVVASVDAAVDAYRRAHAGATPPTFSALVPYFKTKAEAERFRETAQRQGKVLP